MKTIDTGNNESLSVGIEKINGEFLATTFSSSKFFKTAKGAEKWLARKGFDKDGNRAR